MHISELKEIELYEVFPVLKNNLMSVAGEWKGFNENWLKASCKKAYLKRKNIFFRWKIKLYNIFLRSMTEYHWVEIEKRIKKHNNETV